MALFLGSHHRAVERRLFAGRYGPRQNTTKSCCCAQIGMRVTDCWYDQCLVKMCLLLYLISGKSALLYTLYLSSALAVGHCPLLSAVTVHHRPSPFTISSRCSLSGPAVYRCRPYRVSPMCDITTLGMAQVPRNCKALQYVVHDAEEDGNGHRVDHDGTLHLLEGAKPGEKCSNHQEVRKAFGVRCPCEPGSPTAKILTRDGPVVVQVPAALIDSWAQDHPFHFDRDQDCLIASE